MAVSALSVCGHTMRGIVREVRRRASASCRGKDLRANVRARMYWFRRRGYVIDSVLLASARISDEAGEPTLGKSARADDVRTAQCSRGGYFVASGAGLGAQHGGARSMVWR